MRPRKLLRSITPLSAPWALKSFIEAYLVVAEELEEWPSDEPWDEKACLASALGRGEQYRRQRRLTASESVSQNLFASALKLAGNRGLTDGEPADLPEGRRAFAAELRMAARRISQLENVDRDRRKNN